MALTDLGPYIVSYNDIWYNDAHHKSIVAIQVGMHGVTWPWNVMHVSWILNKDKHETKGRRDGHSDGFGSTELLSHSAMTGNLQHVGMRYVVLAKTAMTDQSNQDSLLKPSLFPESQRAMQLWDCISYNWWDGVQLGLQRTSEFSAPEGQVGLSCFLCYLQLFLALTNVLQHTASHYWHTQAFLSDGDRAERSRFVYILKQKCPEIGLKSVWKQAILCVGVSL